MKSFLVIALCLLCSVGSFKIFPLTTTTEIIITPKSIRQTTPVPVVFTNPTSVAPSTDTTTTLDTTKASTTIISDTESESTSQDDVTTVTTYTTTDPITVPSNSEDVTTISTTSDSITVSISPVVATVLKNSSKSWDPSSPENLAPALSKLSNSSSITAASSVATSNSTNLTDSTPKKSMLPNVTESTNVASFSSVTPALTGMSDSAVKIISSVGVSSISSNSSEVDSTTTSPSDSTTGVEEITFETTTEDLSFLSPDLLPPKTEYRKNEPDPRYDY